MVQVVPVALVLEGAGRVLTFLMEQIRISMSNYRIFCIIIRKVIFHNRIPVMTMREDP